MNLEIYLTAKFTEWRYQADYLWIQLKLEKEMNDMATIN